MKAFKPTKRTQTPAPAAAPTKRGGKKGRSATIAALTLALGTAVYLNWSFAQRVPVQQTDTVVQDAVVADADAAVQESDAIAVYDALPTDTPVAAPEDTGSQSANKNYGEAQLVSVSKDSGSEFFEQARLTRSKARDEALDELEKALKKSGLSQEEKDALSARLSTQLGNLTKESDLETLIKAKGFADCVVMLTADSADVTVMTENDALSEKEVTQIRDVVLSRCADLDAQAITVVEVK